MGNDKVRLFASESVLKAILRLALPSMLSQVILVLYNLADTLFVSLRCGAASVTAVTLCTPLFMFLSAIGNLFGVGGAAAAARAFGRGDRDRAERSLNFAAAFGAVFTALYCLAVFLLANPLVDLVGGTHPQVHGEAVRYLRVTVAAGGLPTVMGMLWSHLLRSVGHASTAGFGISLGGVLNIALDPLFMFVLLPAGEEVLGAALATFCANLLAFLFYVFCLTAKPGTLPKLKLSRRLIADGIPGEVLANGLPACLMTFCENLSFAVMDKLMCPYGVAVQAGIGVAKKANMLAHSLVRGLTQGVLPLIGYNYAAGGKKRTRAVVLSECGIAVGLAVICAAASLLLARPIIGIFLEGEELAAASGTEFLRLLALGAPFSALAYAVISFCQALGENRCSLTLTLLRKGAVDIPLMFAFRALWGSPGIAAATPAADLVCCAAAAVMLGRLLHRIARGA